MSGDALAEEADALAEQAGKVARGVHDAVKGGVAAVVGSGRKVKDMLDSAAPDAVQGALEGVFPGFGTGEDTKERGETEYPPPYSDSPFTTPGTYGTTIDDSALQQCR